jgi:hypothetical protein
MERCSGCHPACTLEAIPWLLNPLDSPPWSSGITYPRLPICLRIFHLGYSVRLLRSLICKAEASNTFQLMNIDSDNLVAETSTHPNQHVWTAMNPGSHCHLGRATDLLLHSGWAECLGFQNLKQPVFLLLCPDRVPENPACLPRQFQFLPPLAP